MQKIYVENMRFLKLFELVEHIEDKLDIEEAVKILRSNTIDFIPLEEVNKTETFYRH